MPINLRVGSQFDEDAARRAKAEAVEYYKRQAAELLLKAKLDVKSAQDAAKEAGVVFNRDLALVNTRQLRVDAMLNKDAAAKVAAEFNAELKAMKNPVIEVKTKIDTNPMLTWAKSVLAAERDVKTIDRAMESFGRTTKNVVQDAEQGFSRIQDLAAGAAKVVENMGLTSTSGLGAGGPLVMTGVIAGLIEVAGVAASAAQAIWILPAAIGAAGAAFGTLALATQGFGQALKDMGDPKKFADDLRGLAPSAQGAALAIQGLMPAFTQLKNATQEAFFSGFGQQIQQLTTQYLPQIQQMTTGIAGAFNSMLTGVSQQLMTPQTMGALQTTLTNITQAFQNLAPAAAPFVKALSDIAAVGSSFLPGLASSIADAAQSFATFIANARQSGDLKRWLGEGLTTLKELGQGAIALAKAFMELAPIGSKIMPDILKVLESVKSIMPEIGAVAVLMGPAFGVWQLAASQVKLAIDEIKAAFEFLRPEIQVVGDAFVTAMNVAAGAVNVLLGPLRDIISMINMIPGVNVGQIPDLPTNTQFSLPTTTGGFGSPGVSTLGGGAGSQMERRGGAGGASTAATPADAADIFSKIFGTPASTGAIGGGTTLAPATGPSSALPWGSGAPAFKAPSSSGGGGGGGGGSGASPSLGAAPSSYAGGNGGAYPGDAALLANIPAGKYGRQYGSDLTKGLGDCSSAVEDLVALIQGRSTAGASMTTLNEAQMLAKWGLVPTATPVPGALNVGFNSGHTQATLPGGTPFNWGSDPAAKAGGIGGGGAWAPGLTSHYYLPGGAGAAGGAGPLGSAPPSGSGIPVYVTNMGSGGFAGSGGSGGSSGGGGGGGVGGSSGNPLSAFFGGLAQGGGPLGPLGTLGNNIMGQLGGGGGGGGGGGAAGLSGGGLLGMLSGGPGGPAGMGKSGIQPTGMNWGAGGPGVPSTASPFDPTGTESKQPEVQGRGQSEGVWQPKGGGFQGIGGLPAAAITGAAGAFPGGGQAAQMGMEIINKVAGFAGQSLAIGGQGLMETLLPHGSALGDPGNSWLGKGLAGFAGAHPASPGTAGKLEVPSQQQKPEHNVDPNGTAHGTGKGQAPGPAVHIENLNNNGNPGNGQAVAADIARQTNAYGAGMGH